MLAHAASAGSTRAAGAIEQFERHAGLFQHGDVLSGAVELSLGAEQLHRTEAAAFVGNAGFGAQLARQSRLYSARRTMRSLFTA